MYVPIKINLQHLINGYENIPHNFKLSTNPFILYRLRIRELHKSSYGLRLIAIANESTFVYNLNICIFLSLKNRFQNCNINVNVVRELGDVYISALITRKQLQIVELGGEINYLCTVGFINLPLSLRHTDILRNLDILTDLCLATAGKQLLVIKYKNVCVKMMQIVRTIFLQRKNICFVL